MTTNPNPARTIPVSQPRSPVEDQALNAALFERTRAERLELALRRALLQIQCGAPATAQGIIMGALLQ